jgi:hypothetical protein
LFLFWNDLGLAAEYAASRGSWRGAQGQKTPGCLDQERKEIQVAVPSLHQTAERFHHLAGQIALLLTQARQRPGSMVLRVRLAQRRTRFHSLAFDARAAERAGRDGREPLAALPVPRLASCPWLLVLLLGCGLIGGALWASSARVSSLPLSPARLVACTKPTLAADPQAPCPQPLPGGTSTTLLGTCPSTSSAQNNQVTQIASCTQVGMDATTYTFYGVMGLGLLCLVWWLATLVKAIGGQHPAALGLVVKNFALACFAFLVAWSIQAGFGQLEQLLVAAEQNSEALPFSALVFLVEVLLVLLIRVGIGIALLKMLLSFLAGFGAVAEGHPRALALTTVRLRVIALLLVVLVVAPWLLTQVAHIITGS